MAMLKTQYLIGDPPTIKIDMENFSSEIVMKTTKQSLHQLWNKQFQRHSHVTVFLSGGIDSQFSALIAKENCEQIRAQIFKLKWNNSTVNAEDVMTAMEFSTLNQIPYDIMEVDLKDFLENKLEDFAREYMTTSPQIAVQLWCISEFARQDTQDTTYLMGGESPIICTKGNKLLLPGNSSDTGDIGIFKLRLPFEIFAHEHNVQIIRDPFYMSPEILYAGYVHNCNVVQKHRAVLNLDDPLRAEITEYKKLYYNELVQGLAPPLLKRTGFESLRYYLAAQTGIYNEFDKRYRVPLQNMIQERLGRGSAVNIGVPNYSGDIEMLKAYLSENIDLENIRYCNTYKFDW